MRGGADASELVAKPKHNLSKVGAAPHLAAAIFSPYGDGEKDAVAPLSPIVGVAYPTHSIGTCPGSASTLFSQAATAG